MDPPRQPGSSQVSAQLTASRCCHSQNWQVTYECLVTTELARLSCHFAAVNRQGALKALQRLTKQFRLHLVLQAEHPERQILLRSSCSLMVIVLRPLGRMCCMIPACAAWYLEYRTTMYHNVPQCVSQRLADYRHQVVPS